VGKLRNSTSQLGDHQMSFEQCKPEDQGKEQNESGHEKELDENQTDQVAEDEFDYMPDFIHEILQNPPILPSESRSSFEHLFESFEFGYSQRPKTDLEYFWTMQATISAWELMRYDRMKVAIVSNERRPAVELLHRKYATEPSTKHQPNEEWRSARDGGMKYFTDPDYRTKFAAKLERAGFAPNAVESQAFLRALPSLATLDRLIKSAEKRLAECFKKLDAAYATRDPEDPMPRSPAALRMDDLARRNSEKMKQARLNGHGKADSSE
jgi:hypothetical protein